MSDARGSSALELIAVVVRRRRTILLTTAIVLLVALAAVLLKPRTYTARTILVPATSTNQQPSLAAAIPEAMLPLTGMRDPNFRFIEAAIRSRTLADRVVQAAHAEGHRDTVRIRKILKKKVRISGGQDEGAIKVDVKTNDPKLSAALANLYPPILNEIATNVAVELAQRRSAVLERQIQTASQQLTQSEEQLARYQRGTRTTPQVEEQAKQTIAAAAQLRQSILEQEVKVTQLRRIATPDNPEYRDAVSQLEAMRAQLRNLATSRLPGDVFISLAESPELRVNATRLLRDYAKNEQIYISLTGALAQAQLDSNSNLPVVSVLDRAIPPGEPDSKRLPLILVLGVLFGIATGIVVAFVRELLEDAGRDPANQEFIEALNGVRLHKVRVRAGGD